MHLHGLTQEKTLQARLSEDIMRLRENSLFFRTQRARFFLREFVDNPKIPDAFKTEFFARPRRKDLRRERVLSFRKEEFASVGGELVSRRSLDRIFARDAYRYVTWPELQPFECPVFSYVIIHRAGKILLHSVGRFRQDSKSREGLETLGFGSAVRVQDADLLYDAYHGIVGSGLNELVYSLGLDRELAKKARYGSDVKLRFGLIDDYPDIGQHVRAVMTYKCPAEFEISKLGLAVNKLSWADMGGLEANRTLDNASQMIMRHRLLPSLIGDEW